MRRVIVTMALVAAASPAWADSHGVTIVNSGGDTIRRIEIGNGENRLRSQVPPGASARITFSTSCTAEVRLGFDGGRTETFPAVDICSDPRIATGQGVVGQGGMSQGSKGQGGPGQGSTQTAAAGKAKPGTQGVVTSVVAPPPVVPPWTGKSITKRFGGMD